MTCPWAPTAGGTAAQFSQRNDGVTEPNMQRLHQRLSHINRTLHADIEKPTTLEKTFNNLHKINYVFMKKKKLNFVEKNLHLIVGTTQYCDTQQTIHNTNHTQHKIRSCYIISFETFFAFDCQHNTVL